MIVLMQVGGGRVSVTRLWGVVVGAVVVCSLVLAGCGGGHRRGVHSSPVGTSEVGSSTSVPLVTTTRPRTNRTVSSTASSAPTTSRSNTQPTNPAPTTVRVPPTSVPINLPARPLTVTPHVVRFPVVVRPGGSSTAIVTVKYLSPFGADVVTDVDTPYFSVDPQDCGFLTAGRICVLHLRFTPDPTLTSPITVYDYLHVVGPPGHLVSVQLEGTYNRR